MSETVTSADGTTIGFDRYGDGGDLVVFVGGAFQHRAIDGDTARMARTLAAQGRTVVHYDRRGRGDSTDIAPYAVQREVEDLVALLDAHGGRGGVFGMSSGANLVLEALLAGAPITRAVLYEPPLRMPSRPTTADDATLVERIETACTAGRPGDAVEAFLGGIVAPEMLAGMRRSPIWAAFESVAPTLAYDCRIVEASVGADSVADLERFASIGQPVLASAGEHGDAFMREAAAAVARTLPAGEHLLLPGQSHEVDVDVLGPVLAARL